MTVNDNKLYYTVLSNFSTFRHVRYNGDITVCQGHAVKRRERLLLDISETRFWFLQTEKLPFKRFFFIRIQTVCF